MVGVEEENIPFLKTKERSYDSGFADLLAKMREEEII